MHSYWESFSELFSEDLNGQDRKNVSPVQPEKSSSSPVRELQRTGAPDSFPAASIERSPSGFDRDGSLLEQGFGWVGVSPRSTLAPSNSGPVGSGCGCCSCQGQEFSANYTIQETRATATTLQSSAATLPSATTPAVPIDGLLSGFKWNFTWGTRQLTYSFFNGGGYYGNTSVSPVSEATRNNIRAIFQNISGLVNIDFVEVSETSGNFGRIRFLLDPTLSSLTAATTTYPTTDALDSQAGDVRLNPIYDNASSGNGFQNPAGRAGYMTLIHEIGHALGLKHSNTGTPVLTPGEDNTTNTVMRSTANGGPAGTFMTYDIKALQFLYGARNSSPGDDTYRFAGRIDQYTVNGQAFLTTNIQKKLTLWDGGGLDTLDFSQLSSSGTGYRFDINPGGIVTTRSAYNGTTYTVGGASYSTTTFGTSIAYDVVIENVVASSSNDEIFLNSAANTVSGYRSSAANGNDIIWNATNQDTLDLSPFATTSVTSTQSGTDLILGLGANGSVTIKNYFSVASTERMNIRYQNSPAYLSIADLTVNEGGGTASLTVTLSNAVSDTVTVNYSTADNTAIAGRDYIATAGTLTFAPNTRTATLTVGIIDNAIFTPSGTGFRVNLSNAQKAAIGDGQADVTVINNDLAPTLAIQSNLSVVEGTLLSGSPTANSDITVTLSNPSSQTVTLKYATADGSALAGSDYLATSGTLTFNPGETSKSFSIAVYGDSIAESDETLLINFTDPLNATLTNNQTVFTIVDDDSAQSLTANSVLTDELLGGTTSGRRGNRPASGNQPGRDGGILAELFSRGLGTGRLVSGAIDPFSRNDSIEIPAVLPPATDFVAI
ncbi:Calx-beta domain-containing protein [Pannus brasiliensis CCIBt3594]|uniref:Calx-beta domain-containing protein n=1 Tax=Pannus brasiliensis CCIBt3594 TaxID=1427578 RepID=A0AAW9QXF3_9CHRO